MTGENQNNRGGGPGVLLEALKELSMNHGIIMKEYRERTGKPVAGLSCPFIPFEILAAHGVTPVVVPSFLIRDLCIDSGVPPDLSPDWGFDFFLFPEACPQRPRKGPPGAPIYSLKTPTGWGDEAAGEWRASLERLIPEIPQAKGRIPCAGELKEITGRYDSLRRLIRAVSLARMEKSPAMGYGGLLGLYEYCMVFPPDLVSGYCVDILESLRAAPPSGRAKPLKALISSGSSHDPHVLQGIEDEGCLIVWDDCCPGGRGFDLSFSGDSGDLYGDILHAFSFHPLCPCLRPPRERYDLLYSMVKKYGIDLVVFLDDVSCRCRREEAGFLMTRLKRGCVDVIRSDSAGIAGRVREYMKRVSGK